MDFEDQHRASQSINIHSRFPDLISITKKSLPPPRIILDSESSHNNLKPQLATIKARHPLPGVPLDDWPPKMPQDSRDGKRPPGTNEIRKPGLDIYSLMAFKEKSKSNEHHGFRSTPT